MGLLSVVKSKGCLIGCGTVLLISVVVVLGIWLEWGWVVTLLVLAVAFLFVGLIAVLTQSRAKSASNAIEQQITAQAHQQMMSVRPDQRPEIQELQEQLETNHAAIAGTRKELLELLVLIDETGAKLSAVETAYKEAELEYTSASTVFNEYNLSLTRHQSKIYALQQELSFKINQVIDLTVQIETNQGQLIQTHHMEQHPYHFLNHPDRYNLDQDHRHRYMVMRVSDRIH